VEDRKKLVFFSCWKLNSGLPFPVGFEVWMQSTPVGVLIM
jgi:hypothetical protein